ncbi:hypothetical protein GOBAR_AA34637 [Gossypium barbadense]|uniref:Chlorophyll a-b binding protein, chloroplastic n=1 Tax=Gossypium barbadense TaxID=3634 RepID=A0A2P5W4M2_GOSBA|nr:hypothetical protein GOBAR_AA34637 [Gossypium barbadense]
MIGDRGFDPFGFAKPAEYLQFDLDSLDQNLAKNEAGEIIGVIKETAELKPTPFQPYTEVFGLQRFRECELIHGRWAMLGTLGAIAVEALTGVAWQDAGKVELVEGSSYLGQPLPFSLTTLIWIEVLVIGYIEFQRNSVLEPEKRLYPGGYFDPLGLASDPDKIDNLKLAEIKHSRLAMVAFLIFGLQAAITGKDISNQMRIEVSFSIGRLPAEHTVFSNPGTDNPSESRTCQSQAGVPLVDIAHDLVSAKLTQALLLRPHSCEAYASSPASFLRELSL